MSVPAALPLRRPRLFGHADVRLFPGRHGLPPPLVRRIQRDRLIDAMVAVAGAHGYHDATVRRVIAHAGISRRTFYDVFRDREECFLAAFEEITDWALMLTAAAYRRGSTAEERAGMAIEAFLSFWAAEPDAARTCLVEVLAVGPRGRDARARTMERLARQIEPAVDGPPEHAAFAARVFVGGLHELAYARILGGRVAALPELAGDLMASGFVSAGLRGPP